MADDNYGFCPHCGMKVESDASFCPQCGSSLGNSSPTQSGPVYAQYTNTKTTGRSMVWIYLLLGLYTAFSLIGGLGSIASPDATVEALKTILGADGWAQFLSDYGMTTDQEYIDFMVKGGIVTLISGVFAAVSLLLVLMKRYNTLSVVACILASVSLFAIIPFCNSATLSDNIISSAFQCIIGLLVALLIYKRKSEFMD